MTKKWKIHTFINLLIVLVLLAIPYIFPICTEMIETAIGGKVPMKCHWSMLAELALSLPLFIMVIIQFFLQNPATRQLSAGFILPLGMMVILIPQKFFIGVCKASMPCNTSKIAWAILGSLLILNALLQIRISAQERKYSN